MYVCVYGCIYMYVYIYIYVCECVCVCMYLVCIYNFYMTSLCWDCSLGTGGERESVMLLIKNSLCVDGTGLAGGGQSGTRWLSL